MTRPGRVSGSCYNGAACVILAAGALGEHHQQPATGTSNMPPPVELHALISVSPEKLVAGGDSLSRIDGFPLFVRGIYPGDHASVRVTEVKKGFARGDLVEILEAGPDRKEMPCPVAQECGGCDWTALRLDRQLEAKRLILAESLQRIGKFAAPDIPSIRIHPSPLNYRLRSRLQVAEDGTLGFFGQGTHTVIPLPSECEVVGPEVIARLTELRDIAAERADDTDHLLTLEHEREFVFTDGRAELPASISVRDFTWEISTSSFFQVNRHLLGTLIELVTALASRNSRRDAALDLYSGVGFFTLPIARLFGSVVAVEGSPGSHRLALRNVSAQDNVRAVGGEVEDYLRTEAPRADFVFVDPPRAGLSPEVTDGIATAARERICYLSCDPVTFSRDAFRLARRGWSLRSLDLVDLFPNTHHIETLSSFEREP